MKPKAALQRRLRRDCITFFATLRLHVLAGFDMAYSWKETLRVLGQNPEFGAARFEWNPPQRFPDFVRSLGSQVGGLEGAWLQVLAELYDRGAPLSEALGSFVDSCLREQERELELYQRNLPTVLNLILILFFVPPLFLLCLVPLIFSF